MNIEVDDKKVDKIIKNLVHGAVLLLKQDYFSVEKKRFNAIVNEKALLKKILADESLKKNMFLSIIKDYGVWSNLASDSVCDNCYCIDIFVEKAVDQNLLKKLHKEYGYQYDQNRDLKDLRRLAKKLKYKITKK